MDIHKKRWVVEVQTWIEVQEVRIKSWTIAHVPAWVRHPVAIFTGTFVTIVIGSIIYNKGFTDVPDWGYVFRDALDNGAVAAVGGFAAMFALPLTDAYGAGKSDSKTIVTNSAIR